ncbi:MAG: hypothetical protein HFE45_03230 [Oscillospiraceae bacterium]|nr:hypothetical protein [Oscillospiraceae bacterium]
MKLNRAVSRRIVQLLEEQHMLLGRTADEKYITANLRRLNTFTDMEKGHWAYYDVMEAANSHSADMTDTEEWGR